MKYYACPVYRTVVHIHISKSRHYSFPWCMSRAPPLSSSPQQADGFWLSLWESQWLFRQEKERNLCLKGGDCNSICVNHILVQCGLSPRFHCDYLKPPASSSVARHVLAFTRVGIHISILLRYLRWFEWESNFYFSLCNATAGLMALSVAELCIVES
jgi:hypothetical protein